MVVTNFDKLEDRLGYKFNNSMLLKQALSHKSAVPPLDSYERMEFLGDRVLGLVLAETLYAHYPNADQGELTKRFHAQAQQSALAQLARKLQLQEAIFCEHGSNLTERDSVLCDVMEAVIAAIYLDSGIEYAAKLILDNLDWQAPLNTPLINPKSALQEWSDGQGLGLPVYRVISREGPDHELEFTVEVSVADKGRAEGKGGNKKTAEFNAALSLLTTLQATE